MATSARLDLGQIKLPIEAVTQTFVVLGKRGSGKTTTARVLAEELLHQELPVVVLDPTGVWWGLRSSADGKGDGYPVVIFGGDHADVPLEETAGKLISDVIRERRIPAVLDLSGLSKSASRRFVADFLEQLYHRNRDPLHLIIDEADLFAPQRTYKGTERLVGAMDDIVRRGRVRGLGCTLISQRPAVLNKDVSSQAEVLVALRLTGVRDVAAIDEWVQLHADDDEAKRVKASLPSLPVGTAWFWSPGWLDLLERVTVRHPTTFDSSATPVAGHTIATVRRMAPIDLAALGEQITATVERSKAEDPKALRAEIARLKRQVAVLQEQVDHPLIERVEVPVKVPVLGEETIKGLGEWCDTARALQESFDSSVNQVLAAIQAALLVQREKPAEQRRPTVTPSRPADAPTTPTAPRRPTLAPSTGATDASLGKAARKILNVLAQHDTSLSVSNVAVLSGYSAKGGGFRNTLGSLRTSGYVEGYGELQITQDGRDALGEYTPLPTGAELRQWWQDQPAIGLAASKILDVLAEAYPAAMTADQIAEATDYSPKGGGFRNSLGRLRSLNLVRGYGEITIDESLI